MFLKKIIYKIWKQRSLVALLILWSLLVFMSAIWNLHENFRGTYDKAEVEAETIFQHNLAYRRWNSMHGGVYARVSEINQPNELIVGKKRDFTGLDGTKFTMINPFQMTKQAYDLLRIQSPELAVLNRTVSLEPLNVENSPDEWETKALEGFENGEGALSEITTIDGAPYMRLISPYITETRCLGCHEHQGYDVGDIRGGMSVAVPMEPYYKAAESARRIIVKTHLFLWSLGFLSIVFFFIGLRRYQSTIEKNEEKFRIVSEFAYNFEYWINQNKKLAFISPSCARITGYSRKEIRKNPQLLFDMIHPGDQRLFKDHLFSFDDEAHEDLEYRIITKDGKERWMSHVCSPIYADGVFLGRRGSNRDITEHKLLQEDLNQARKLEDLGHFAGGVAHDFNNVLTSISTLSHLMMDEVDEENDVLNDYIENITIAAKLGRNLTSNLLSFGRKRTLELKKSQLSSIISNIRSILLVLLRKDISCKISLTEKEKFVMIDPHQVEQILINLSTNARDAMSDGGTLSIETSSVSLEHPKHGRFGDIPAGEYMVLSVADTGHGISEKDQQAIFEPFYSTKESSKGTGLGLAIVDSIIKQHNSFIDVESTLGKGTKFRIFFPVSNGEKPQDDSSVQGIEREGNKKTVLIVDDDWFIRKSLLAFLQKAGFDVLTAGDGEEGISQFRKHSRDIDLVVLDVMLPKKDGREVYDTLKAENKALEVLFISGSPDEVLAEKNIFRDQLDFISKPFDMGDFAAKVGEILKRGEVD